MARETVSERAALEAAKREDLRKATQELIGALALMTSLLRRTLETTELPTGSTLRTLEREFDEASEHLLKLSGNVGHIATCLRVNPWVTP
jgi:hypothetical protein